MNLLATLCLVGACASGSSAPQRDSSSVSPPARTATRELPESLLDGAAETNTLVAAPPARPFELPSPAILSSRAQGRASTSTSLGSPSNGSLVGGVALPAGVAGIRFNERRDTGARFATVEVIATIMNAAQAVHARFAESELTVNDLSLPGGGRIAHHGSHRAGRDADILFYLRGDDGNATESVGAPIDLDGIGFDFKELHDEHDDVRVHFDAERTWLFIAALLENREAPVQRIFVAEHLRGKLLEAASAAHAAPETVAFFADVTCQPSYPHDDHLHVRWFCSVEDLGKGCEDLPPLYPWRAAELAAAGVAPVLAGRSRSVDPAPITTQAQAAQNVKRQRPHPLVLAFLARRKAWEKEPHPRRPYCR